MAGNPEFHFDSQLLEYIKSGRVDKVKSMLNENLAKAFDESKNTLLHYAVLENNEAIVQHLLDLGAEVDYPGKDGKTPLMLAIELDNRSIENFLNENNDITDTGIALAIFKSIQYSKCRSIRVVKLLLKRLINETVDMEKLVDKIVGAGFQLVDCAAYLKDVEIIRRMLERGFDVNSKDNDGRTALHLAALYNEATMAKLLIDYHANVNEEHDDGHSPLMIAACNGSKETMKILLEAGANPNARDEDLDWTAILMVFINLKNEPNEVMEECLELLFQYGVVPQNTSQLFNVAAKRKDSKKINMLMNYLVMLKELGRPFDDLDFHCNDEQTNSSISVGYCV